ncbi:Uncharacterised protein [BD1-7 clade bacterium]|uniref:DUF2750 domain-containing protein n=1 Tax=BD1-7 clade bacterium TaxID=2029982 RepID=A0A5S9PMD4_9GAMM|nr:Uncharacterised protein [BD1-7 clade bacterium]CAA0110254.1 Uncharacterised protein [BD1-7 clade bacterium]CAA0112810.1 Uncharacterised protein [BD1-7 clade bacterium]
MTEQSFDEILAMSCEDRYEIFLSMVADERDLWILVNDNNEFLKIHSDDLDNEFLPVWPHADFTTPYCNGNEETLKPKSITVPEFFAKWVPGLERDGLDIVVFPNGDDDVWIMSPSEVKDDLQEAFSNFEF